MAETKTVGVIENESSRLELMIQKDGLARLKASCVMIVGIGGVGSYCAEALARSGIGKLILVDGDTVALSNLNRQIHALYPTLGQSKCQAMKERIAQFAKDCEVDTAELFFNRENGAFLLEQKIDYIIDAIDTLSSKMDLIELARNKGIPVISSLGMGNRMDPARLTVTLLSQTSYDPLARSLRVLARKRGFNDPILCVFSTETPMRQHQIVDVQGKNRKQMMPPASSVFVPAAAGLLLASTVCRHLLDLSSRDQTIRSLMKKEQKKSGKKGK